MREVKDDNGRKMETDEEVTFLKSVMLQSVKFNTGKREREERKRIKKS